MIQKISSTAIVILIALATSISANAQQYPKEEKVYVLKSESILPKTSVENIGGYYYSENCFGYFQPTYETRVYRNNTQHPGENGFSSCESCKPSGNEQFVYWAEEGDPDGTKRFHNTDLCVKLKFDVVSMARNEAESKGFVAFSDCFEDDLGEIEIPK